MTERTKYYLLLPVFDDWVSLGQLLGLMKRRFAADLFSDIRFVLVDDASNQGVGAEIFEGFDVVLLHLRRNLGHQRAIAIGLSHIVAGFTDYRAIVVMDSDGEDTPEGVMQLIEANERHPGFIVFASRRHRQNGMFFKTAYWLYRCLFTLLTGSRISFGNFCLLPFAAANRLVHVSEIWSHFPGGIMRSKIPYLTVPVDRGKRISGNSQMKPVNLILHGLGSIAVHLETVAVRLMLFFLGLLGISGIGILTVLYLKLFTRMAIPGWATTAFSGLSLIFLQALFIALFLAFIILNYRIQRPIIPALDYKDYVEEVTEHHA